MIHIAKVCRIGYIPNDKEHTVAYRKNVLHFLGAGDAESREVPEGHYKQAVGETEGEAFRRLRQQVVEVAIRCQIRPEDVWISMVSIEVGDDGLFWPLHRQSTERKMRLSDLEVVSVWN